MDLESIVATLSRTRGVDDWVVRETREEELQAYVAGARTETVRRVESTRWGGTLLNDHGGKRGMAAFHLAGGADAARVLGDAVTMASLSNNPPFRLPGAGTYPAVESVDPDIARDPQGALATLQKQLRKGSLGAGVRLSSAEVFVRHRRTRIANSRGVRGEREGTEVYVEAVLTAAAHGAEAEHFFAQRFRRVADASLGWRLEVAARFARDTLAAKEPPTGSLPVVLAPEALTAFFEPIVFRSGAYAAYQKMAPLAPGDVVHRDGERRGEALSLESDGLAPFGLATTPFDDEGIASRRLAVVEGGGVAARWATQQYAEYMGMEATGAFANTRVGCGARPRADLLAGALEVVSFSAFDPDSVTGDFGAEVRIGYLHGPGGAVPVKGGSVSGNVFAALANAWFAKEETSHEAYVGPGAVRVEGLSVAGA